MKSPLLQLRDAIAGRIESVTGFKIHDDFPGPDAAYPHVVLGEMLGFDWSDKFKPGMAVTASVHVWSAYHGSAETLNMMDAILQALTVSPIKLGESFNLTLDRLEQTRIITDIDGITRHGIIERKYLVEEM